MGYHATSRTRPITTNLTLVWLFGMALGLAAPGRTEPITITNGAGLEFGGLVPYSGGTVVVSPAGVRTKAGSVMLVTRAAYPPSAASFTVTGDANAHYSITLPVTDVLLTSDTATMSVSDFTKIALSGTIGVLSGATPGTQTIKVGATLHVTASQAVGRYVGSFAVTVNYE